MTPICAHLSNHQIASESNPCTGPEGGHRSCGGPRTPSAAHSRQPDSDPDYTLDCEESHYREDSRVFAAFEVAKRPRCSSGRIACQSTRDCSLGGPADVHRRPRRPICLVRRSEPEQKDVKVSPGFADELLEHRHHLVSCISVGQ